MQLGGASRDSTGFGAMEEGKAMTNLESILKSRDITLPTKVCIVKAMVFPVAMYGCESWTWRREWLHTPVFLPGESQGQRTLEG